LATSGRKFVTRSDLLKTGRIGMRDTLLPRPAPRPVPRRPRSERDLERAHNAAATARVTANGEAARPGLAAALAAIETAFGQAAVVNDPSRVRARGHTRPLCGASCPSSRKQSRHSHRRDRTLAARRAARLRDRERLRSGSRLPLAVLDELRLLLRWLRFKRMHAEYAAALAALNNAPMLEAAE
jgi:hypothetical protein